MKLYLKNVLGVLLCIFSTASIANATSHIPTGRAIPIEEILNLSQSIGGFLIVAGGIIAGIAIIWSGIVYVTSGSDSARVKSAKDMLKVAIIGAFILSSTGVIIKIIKGLASDPLQFFR